MNENNAITSGSSKRLPPFELAMKSDKAPLVLIPPFRS